MVWPSGAARFGGMLSLLVWALTELLPMSSPTAIVAGTIRQSILCPPYDSEPKVGSQRSRAPVNFPRVPRGVDAAGRRLALAPIRWARVPRRQRRGRWSGWRYGRWGGRRGLAA